MRMALASFDCMAKVPVSLLDCGVFNPSVLAAMLGSETSEFWKSAVALLTEKTFCIPE